MTTEEENDEEEDDDENVEDNEDGKTYRLKLQIIFNKLLIYKIKLYVIS